MTLLASAISNVDILENFARWVSLSFLFSLDLALLVDFVIVLEKSDL